MDGAFNLTGVDISEAEKETGGDPQYSPTSASASASESEEKSQSTLLAEKNAQTVDGIKHMTDHMFDQRVEDEKSHLQSNTTAAKFDELFGGESELADYHIDTDNAPRSLEEIFEKLEIDEEALSNELDSRYHGPTARKRLFARHRWHHTQRQNMHSNNEDESEGVLFDNEGDADIDFPFAREIADDCSSMADSAFLTDTAKFGADTVDMKEVSSDNNNNNNNNNLDDDGSLADSVLSSSIVAGVSPALKRYLATSSSLSSLPGSTKKPGRISKNKDADDFPQPGVSVSAPLSPRTRYLDNCQRERVNPRAALIIRKHAATQINLKNLGIGDQMAKIFAGCLEGLPMVKSVDISDNNLTDDGLAPLFKAMMSIPTLEEINLSYNDVDEVTANAIADYIANPDTPLKRLVMRKADVDDNECARFIECLHTNKNLTDLDISNNILGSSENLNTVMPDLTTGAEAMAELLCSKECKLKSVNVAWNMIRLDGAIAMAESLAKNTSLTYLDISYNSFGHDGGLALGDAIMDNRSLKTLNVANNGIDATACFTICVGVIENLALSKLSLNGNPIGEEGAKALMLIPITVGQRVKCTASGCNLIMKDKKCWFDAKNPCRTYKLNLAHPFERAIAFLLLRIVATHPTYIFAKFDYKEDGSNAFQPLELIQAVSTEKAKYIEGEKREAVDGLLKVVAAADDRDKAEQLFIETDTDDSGELDSQELLVLMQRIGIQMDLELIEEAINETDVDGGGTMGLSEFFQLLKSLKKDALARLDDLCQERIMALKSSPSKVFVPARSGVIECEVMDGLKTKDNFSTISTVDHDYVQDVARQSEHTSVLLQHSTLHAKLRLSEAFNIYKTMMTETNNKARVLMKLLPQVKDTSEAKKFVLKATQGDKQAYNAIRLSLGFTVKPIFGNLNGYYVLDMKKETDRLCFTQLLEKSRTMNSKRRIKCPLNHPGDDETGKNFGPTGDTSQRGNWSCFRNERYNRKSIEINLENFTPVPTVGRLEFDYSTVERPEGDHEDVTPVEDARFVRMLMNFKLIQEFDIPDCLVYLKQARDSLNSTNNFRKKSAYEMPKDKALEIGLAMDIFYDNIEERRDSWEKSKEKEKIRIVTKKEPKKKKGRYGGMQSPSAAKTPATPTDQTIPENLEVVVANKPSSPSRQISPSPASKSRERISSAQELDSSLSPMRSVRSSFDVEDSTRDNMINSNEMPPTQEEIDQLKEELEDEAAEVLRAESTPAHAEKQSDYTALSEILATEGLSNHAKCARLNELAEDITSRVWLLCKNVALFMKKYTLGRDTKKTKSFGTYRVELLLEFYPRILDIHNFEIVASELTATEVACFYCRVGILNVFCPMKPEGSIEMNIGRREERIVFKIYAALADVEPGVNWPDKIFQWKREWEPTGGWELTVGWMTDEGCANHGICFVRYYSGECKGLQGCKPSIRSRKGFLLATIHDEKDFIDFEDEKIRSMSYGPKAIAPTEGMKGCIQDRQIWLDLIAPDVFIPLH